MGTSSRIHAMVRTLAVMSLVAFNILPATAGNYQESFSTKEACDTLNTTAWWDTIAGEVKLAPFGMTLAGSCDTPDFAGNVDVAGDYVYVADGTSGLTIIDVSDPTHPTLAGSYDPGVVSDVCVRGDHAFVTMGDYAYIGVMDISDPTNPLLVGSTPISNNLRALDVSGNYAYIVGYLLGLIVVDISDPSNPVNHGGLGSPFYSAYDVVVSGDHAYVADGANGLRVVDISAPLSPSLVATYDTPGVARDVSLSGDYLFLADNETGVLVLDIGNPASPSSVGAYDTPGTAMGVAVAGDFAYVADIDAGIHVLDISDPTAPVYLYSHDTPGSAYDLAISGDRAYVADGGSGLAVIHIADPVGPFEAGLYDTPVGALGLDIAGDYAYVADYTSFQVIDISDPTSPVHAGEVVEMGPIEVAVSGDYAFVTTLNGEMQAYDISNPTAPYLAGACDTTAMGNLWGIAVAGDYAFVGDDDSYKSGVHVIDIGDPTAPSYVGRYATMDLVDGVAVCGDYVYAANEHAGLLVLDVSDPENPDSVAACDTGDATGVCIAGDYAYVADFGSGFKVIDISDPTNPTIAGSCDTPGYAYDVAIAGDLAFVAENYSGFQVIDITDPTSPAVVRNYVSGATTFGVAVDGDYAYLCEGAGGLRVFEVFQRALNLQDNVARSVPVDDSPDDIYFVKLTATQTDSVSWEASSDGGANWTGVPAGSPGWTRMGVAGSDLVWRSTHSYAGGGVNPACSDLEVDWLENHAAIDSIVDVGNDQGKQVRITWTRSQYDFADSPTPITEYAIYRRIDPALAPAALGDAGNDGESAEAPDNRTHLTYPPGDWDYVTAVPARQEDAYSVVVPTLADSTIAGGMYYSTYFVSAQTETLWVYFDSPPDSGYSVDNLSPHVPSGLFVAYNSGTGNDLSWDECQDADFQYFRIYRDESEDFTPSESNYVHGTTGTGWTDNVEDGWKYHYKVTAVDFSGNESPPAVPGGVTGAEAPAQPTVFALYQNVPNPFNPTTVIRYDVPADGGLVTLRIYDVGGRLVRELVDGTQPPGRRQAVWDGRDERGARAASGVYFCRLTAPGFEATRKMTLLQ
jgi:hypothetical protein